MPAAVKDPARNARQTPTAAADTASSGSENTGILATGTVCKATLRPPASRLFGGTLAGGLPTPKKDEPIPFCRTPRQLDNDHRGLLAGLAAPAPEWTDFATLGRARKAAPWIRNRACRFDSWPKRAGVRVAGSCRRPSKIDRFCWVPISIDLL